MTEEQIKARYGNRNPFKAPEGYFDSLTERIMAQIPDNEVMMTPRRKRHVWMYVAAMFCILLASGLFVSKYVMPADTVPAAQMANTEEQVPAANDPNASYVEDMVDYALISDAMVYYEYMSDDNDQ